MLVKLASKIQIFAFMPTPEIELTKSAVIAAMHAADENSNELERLSSLAKFQAGETLHLVSNEAIQMHGGIGVTDEYC